MDLEGKVAFLTGGVGGLGQCMARSLLKSGVLVVLFDLNKEKGEEFKGKLEAEYGNGKVHFIGGDVTKKEDIKEALKETLATFPRLDIMINNAGIMNDNRWEGEIEINLKALVVGSQEATKIMSKENGGNGGLIMNTSSVFGLVPYPLGAVYAATKHAVVAYTLSHGHPKTYEKTGIRTVAICPGLTDTALLDGEPGEVLRKFVDLMGKEFIPQKPENVGNAVPEIIKCAPNGSIWVIQYDQPAFQTQIPHYLQWKVVQTLKN